MGVKRSIQLYGSSYPVEVSKAFDHQFVLFSEPRPVDVTIYLGDGVQPFIADWSVSWGSGKTALTKRLQNAVVGSVLHVVAQTIMVRGAMATAPFPGRIQSQAGFGRPSRIVGRQYVSNIAPGSFLDLPAPPFATSVVITTDDTTSSLTVQPRLIYAPTNNSVGPTLPIAAYNPERPMNALANYLRIINADAVNVWRADVTWFALQ